MGAVCPNLLTDVFLGLYYLTCWTKRVVHLLQQYIFSLLLYCQNQMSTKLFTVSFPLE